MAVDADDSARERFRALYEANYHRILGYALRRVGEAEAGDLVSETFLVAWRRLDEVPSGDEARLWLYGVARRALANHDRGRRRRERLKERAAAEIARTGEPLDGQGHPGVVGIAFSRLRPEDQELLALFAWEALAAAEIAKVCGCSVNAARIRLYRARRRFVRELGGLQAADESAARTEPRGARERRRSALMRSEDLL